MGSKILAYCAGVIDSDGCITIKKRKLPSGYTYAASVFVRQADNGAVNLLASVFGGWVRLRPPPIPGGRPLYHWEAGNRKAVAAATRLLPFLRIKHRQAGILVEFGKHMANHSLRRKSYWFRFAKNEPMYTPQEAADIKKIDRASVYQAISNGAVPSKKRGRRRFIPKRFWDSYVVARGQPLPPEYVDLREEICQRIRRLNGPTRGVTAASRKAARENATPSR